MSSPYPNETKPGAEPPRALLVNQPNAFKWVVNLLRSLWEPAAVEPAAAPSPVPVSEPASPAIPAAEPVPVPEPVAEVEEPAAMKPRVPAGPPRFEARVLWTAKRGNTEAQWEDGYQLDEPAGVVAVADGAGDGIFSKLWADLLLASYMAHPVALDDPEAVEPWIVAQRREWMRRIDYPRQRWSVQLRLDQSCGAATFLGLAIDDQAGRWTAGAVGDVCLFHVRDNRLVDTFPVASAADFGTTPAIFQSKPMRPMPLGVVRGGDLAPGDLLVVATDALAQSLLTEIEADSPPDWARFWDLDQDLWRHEIEALRDRNAIVNDDCTLVVVRPLVATPGEMQMQMPMQMQIQIQTETKSVTETATESDSKPGNDNEVAPETREAVEPPPVADDRAVERLSETPTVGDSP